jgi:cell division protein FtsB
MKPIIGIIAASIGLAVVVKEVFQIKKDEKEIDRLIRKKEEIDNKAKNLKI